MSPNAIATEYLSTGSNRQTAVADWSQRGIVAFGADSNVAIWEPAAEPPRGITALLSGHKDVVKAVAFLPSSEADTHDYLITGSDDKTLIVRRAQAGSHSFETVTTVSDHQGPINCIAPYSLPGTEPRWLIATGSADATIKIWISRDGQLTLLQSIKTMPKFFPLSLAISPLDAEGNLFVLAAAGTRDSIQILTATDVRSGIESGSVNFEVQAKLSGHESWIRSLSFVRETSAPESDLLLASASQDKYIRIWRVHQGKELPALATESNDPLSGAYLPGKSPSNKAHMLKAAGLDYSITFDALLLGHEDWIYSAKWHAHADGKLQLLSTSADNSLAIWEADPGSGIWVSMVRLGEISREKGATTATGSTGGFWTGLWSPDGQSVACLGRTGSWRRWQWQPDSDLWKACVPVTGHTKAVTGIAWSGNGDYLLSTSLDQTTRLHTKWTANGHNTWHEMSRPQIHGYDLNCIDALGASQFVSGADEKLMRVFSEPKAVASMLHRLGGIGEENVEHMPDAANIPVLGLSNKAIDMVEDDEEIAAVDDRDREAIDPASIVKRSYLDIDHPPHEETLSRHTLWPETEKLYGHGYEISCLAASHDGKIVASACKASSINHAVIRLFETDKWTEVRPPLTAHTLTATRIRFSLDDKYILSVGRDRQWAVFGRSPDDPLQYALLQANPKGHTRMILDAAWAPNEKPLFATAGRDKQVRLWHSQADEAGKLSFAQLASIPTGEPVTAVDFLPRVVGGKCVLAVGTESGQLSLHNIDEASGEVVNLPRLEELQIPKTVLQLSWRPGTDADKAELAIAGDDSSLRLFSLSEAYLRGSSP
ncbi:elongator protein 2 [Emericellopsis atlantica]|uniref:Elongator complex protein 2 n=1 Tax=Emericellopsis atlantica TaxID=2614577 RepID=A0A9P7ZG57_9HYPO|nr:elongator protein 2 [Emericellopsis atlantica]KAG9250863.1 elongator protein 2 [Emericellopsis atlantica]